MEPGPQLQWRTWQKEKVKIIEQQIKARGTEIYQSQILGEGDYATIERQSLYNGHTMTLCYVASLTAWNRIEEVGKKIESFTKVINAPPKSLNGFLTNFDISIKQNDTKFRSQTKK